MIKQKAIITLPSEKNVINENVSGFIKILILARQ